MSYIPFISQDDLVLDNKQKRLVGGKIEVLDPISNNPVDIFVYDGSNDDYIVSTNPIYLDVNSRPEHTYFSTQLVLCRLYKYIGNFSDPMVDDDTNNWEFVREWNGSFHENEQKNDTIVYGLTAIQTANPNLGTITVVGYWNEYDCEARTYVWDANCVQTPDNGYIVKVNDVDTGRWVLKFDGAYLPSTYYGVYPGKIANVNALLSYVDTVGTSATKTAPGVYFVPGHYENTTWWNTSKRILIASNTQFDNGINCSWVDVKGTPTTWIGDILPSGLGCPIYSSWYKSARYFWSAVSRHKHCDGHNWTDNTLVAPITNINVTFYTSSITVLSTTTTSDNYLIFNNCTVVGECPFLHRNMKCKFVGMKFTDKYYLTNAIYPANIEFDTTSGNECTFDADEFADLSNLANTAYKGGVSVLDLKGHTASTIDGTEYDTVKNGTINSLTMGKSGVSSQYEIKNVHISNTLEFNGQSLSVVNSNVRLSSFANLNTLNVSDGSIVRSGWILNRGTVSCVDSTWAMVTTYDVTLTFNSSIVAATVNSRIVSLYNSHVTSAGQINVHPLPVATPSAHYVFQLVAENSVFDTDIAFVPGELYDIYWSVRITNNTFNGSQGLTCPYWVDVVTSKRTIAAYATSGVMHSVDYAGNKGNCPKDRYTGQIDCSLSEWVNWNPSWMRGKSNPSTIFKVSYRTFPRFFLVENNQAIASPVFTRADDWGFGMRIGTDTNIGTVSLVNLSEMIADSLDSDFIAWRDANGLTTDTVNDYFMRCRGLAESSFDASYMYYFW